MDKPILWLLIILYVTQTVISFFPIKRVIKKYFISKKWYFIALIPLVNIILIYLFPKWLEFDINDIDIGNIVNDESSSPPQKGKMDWVLFIEQFNQGSHIGSTLVPLLSTKGEIYHLISEIKPNERSHSNTITVKRKWENDTKNFHKWGEITFNTKKEQWNLYLMDSQEIATIVNVGSKDPDVQIYNRLREPNLYKPLLHNQKFLLGNAEFLLVQLPSLGLAYEIIPNQHMNRITEGKFSPKKGISLLNEEIERYIFCSIKNNEVFSLIPGEFQRNEKDLIILKSLENEFVYEFSANHGELKKLRGSNDENNLDISSKLLFKIQKSTRLNSWKIVYKNDLKVRYVPINPVSNLNIVENKLYKYVDINFGDEIQIVLDDAKIVFYLDILGN
jgi:hypothetical protein